MAIELLVRAEPPGVRFLIRDENRNGGLGGRHTGEEVLVAAQGPGAERVHGFIPNTAILGVMWTFGWR
jgi:alkaline phosphatase